MEEIVGRNSHTEECGASTSESEIADEVKASSRLKDAPRTSDEFAKNKQKFQSGNMDVKDNKADNLMIVQNAIFYGNTSFGVHDVREVTRNSIAIGKEYDLSDAEQLAEFGEIAKAGGPFAVAVILCVFEYVELDDLQVLKSKLLAELPKVTDEEGKEIGVYQNAYISINSLIRLVKGKMFITESGQNCIGLGISRPTALKNLWQQFPTMRDHIARWLLNISDLFEYRTNFNTAQIIVAFVNFFKLDFNAGISLFFQKLYSSPDKYWLLGFIALELYNDSAYRHKILPHINQWAESSGSWLWKSALYVYANIRKGEENTAFDDKVGKALAIRCNFLEYDDTRYENLPYIGMLLINSERLRTLIASMLGDLVTGNRNYNEKRLACLWYLELLRYGYYLVSAEMTSLPLVACDKKQQLENLLPMLEVLLSRYDTRRLLFVTLESYLKEISSYEVEKATLNHIKAFLQLLAQINPRFRGDILLFLKRCDCKITKEIEKYLESLFSHIDSETLSAAGVTDLANTHMYQTGLSATDNL